MSLAVFMSVGIFALAVSENTEALILTYFQEDHLSLIMWKFLQSKIQKKHKTKYILVLLLCCFKIWEYHLYFIKCEIHSIVCSL